MSSVDPGTCERETRRSSLPWEFSPLPEVGTSAAVECHTQPPRISPLSSSPSGPVAYGGASSAGHINTLFDSDDEDGLLPFQLPPSRVAGLSRSVSMPTTSPRAAFSGWKPTVPNSGKRRAPAQNDGSPKDKRARKELAAQEREAKKAAKEAAKELAAQERAAKKVAKEAAKEREKAERKALRKASSRKSPQDRMEDLLVKTTSGVHSALVTSAQLGMLEGAKATVSTGPPPTDAGGNPVEHVRWQRKLPRTEYEHIGTFDVEDCSHAVVLITATDFVEMIADDQVLARLARVRKTFPDHYSLTLVIEGLQVFFRKQQSKQNAE